MKRNITLILSGLLFFGVGNVYGFEQIPTAQLLNAYLENDSELKNLAITAKKAELTQESTQIDNGFDVTLSTGTMTFKVSQDGSSLSVKPSVQASIPQASNLSITASSDIYAGSTSKQGVEDASISFSVDIISSNSLNRQIQLLKAERTVKEAERNLTKQAITAEIQFYTELKALLSSTAEIITSKTSYYSDKIDFEEIKAKGYSAKSSSYLLAEMKVLNDEHEIENSERTLIHDYIVFYKKCGYDIQIQEDEDMISYLPSDIPVVELLNIQDFDEEKYSDIEKQVWTKKINDMTRQADSSFSLSANGGYTFSNSNTGTNTVDGGLSSKIGGVNIQAGVNIPVGGASGTSPAYTLGASVNPNTFKKNKIEEQQNQLDVNQEQLAIDDARSDYETVIVDKQQSLNDLLWEKKTYEENYEMYEKLAKDFDNYYKLGVVSESEYLTSISNEKNYKVKLVMNMIDMIIYNDNIKVLFVED